MTDTLISRLADALREVADALYWYEGDSPPGTRARALLAEWEEKKQRRREAPQ